MEIPLVPTLDDSPPPDSPPPTSFAPSRTYPPRSSSPPLPPRKNALGLPPSYSRHLRALLHQWLGQQTRQVDSGLPRQNTQEKTEPLWSEERVLEIEKAIWEGAVLPKGSGTSTRHPGLIDLPWNEWELAAAHRRKVWKEDGRSTRGKTGGGTKLPGKPLVAGDDTDSLNGTISVPPTPPSKSSSTGGLLGLDLSRESSKTSVHSISTTDDDSSSARQVYSLIQALAAARGFVSLEMAKRDEWEVVEDRVPQGMPSYRQLPGAFPQSSHIDHPPQQSTDSLATAPPDVDPAEDSNTLVKPLVCLHFPLPTETASTSTIHLKRHDSAGMDNLEGGQSSQGRWWSGSGSGRRWSGMSTSLGRGIVDDPLQIGFVSGQYALPDSTEESVDGQQRSTRGSTSQTKDGPISGAESHDSDTGSTVSSLTQRADSRFRPKAKSYIIGGGFDDIPRSAVSDKRFRVVGGTIVVRGISREEEQLAVQRVLQVLLFAIQAMHLELELLDTFRVPREADAPPVPPRAAMSVQRSTSSSYGGLKRNGSARERGTRAKGFLQRLGKDTKGLFDGFIGKARHQEDADSPPRSPVKDRFIPTSGLPGTAPENSSESPSSSRPGTPMTSSSTDKHVELLHKLEHILPSTTPLLALPMPAVLLRVQEERRLRKQKVLQETPTAPSSAFRLPGTMGTSAFSAAIGQDIPATGTASRSYRVGGDVRTGLGVLMNDIETFGGWQKLQRLDVLRATRVQPTINKLSSKETEYYSLCEKPTVERFAFWSNTLDESIASFTAGLLENGEVCKKPGCVVEAEGHQTLWYHNHSKVIMHVHKDSGPEVVREQIDAWIRCTRCDSRSQPRPLTQSAALYSWGKLLELIIYTHLLVPFDLCEHSKSSGGSPISTSSFVYHLRTSKAVVTLQAEPIIVLDARLPKLQVGPNVSKRKAAKATPGEIVEGLWSKERRTEDVRVVSQEIDQTFTSMRGQLKASGDALDQSQAKTEAAANDTAVSHVSSQELDATESRIRSTLEATPSGQINSIRRELILSVRQFQRSVKPPKSDTIDTSSAELPLPVYVDSKKVHVLPGSSVVIREDEPSSIIAYTLSSLAYFAELTNSGKEVIDPSTLSTSPSETSASATTAKDVWSIEVKRKDTPRDLLSLRTLSKKRSDASMSKGEFKPPMSLTPNQPSLEVSLAQAQASSHASDNYGDLVKTITKATAHDPALSARSRRPSLSDSDAGSIHAPTPRGTPKRPDYAGMRQTSDSLPRAPPPSAFKRSLSGTSTAPSTPRMTSTVGSTLGVPNTPTRTPVSGPGESAAMTGSATEGWGSVTSTFTSSLNNLIRLGSDIGSFRVRGSDRSLSALMGPLGMMDNSLAAATKDELPHIQFTYTLSEKMRITCTVYYATAFDSLRRRCAIDKSIVESLSDSETWDAQGGKSKACFFMTKDKRYIVKELVSKWNVSDTQALLDIAPSYLEHLANTHNRATSLAKIVGFYTVKIHDLQSSSRKQLDLLVMENLFYKQDISQTFDLKGIEGRRVPKSTEGNTLFDGEWLDSLAKEPILLHPHAKRILSEAMTHDTRFLSAQSIMDYSLLIGLDLGKKELVAGLVDAIGSYNLFKTIESRGKLALNRGGEVTIIPPDQYRDRFENALKQYFIACPDKWSKPSRSKTLLSAADDTIPSII